MMMVWAPRMMAFNDEAQTLFTVVATTVLARPAPRAHWRAGAWPRLGKAGQSGQFCTQIGRVHRSDYVLGGQDIAEEDLLNILRLDLGDPVNGGCGPGRLC